MPTLAPEIIPVRRSELRQNQSRLLRKAKGRTILVVKGPHDEDEDEKVVLDRQYWRELTERYASLLETVQILSDQRLFGQILAAAGTLEEDVRRGRLHSLEEAFGEG